jgi:hypothetical protein
MRSPNERYHRRFLDVLRSETLAAAESAIRGIDELCRKYRQQHDRAGIRAARDAVLKARQHALEIVAQESDPHRRAVFAEMAGWFTIWLQTPEVFETWLELRKASAEFREKFTAC